MSRVETSVVLPETSYDDVLYDGFVQGLTHPGSLAAMAALHGLAAPPVATARVLDLGCGAAANLLSIAATLPGAECVGVDLAPRPIAMGRALAEEAGLRNVRLEVGSVADLPADLGRFDYIVAHGLYSWVPPAVADALLGACGRHLAPGGVAYLSYNTYPGWFRKRMAREMMAYHVRDIADPARRVEQGRALVMLLAIATPDAGAFRAALREEADDLRECQDWYLLHDQLGAENHPLYFHEMASRALAHGLRWVAKAEFVAWEDDLEDGHAAPLATIAPRERREQYLDFLGNRTFRRDLFGRADGPPAAGPSAEALGGLWFSGEVEPVGPEPAVGDAETFRRPQGDELTTAHGPLRAILRAVAGARPGAVSFAGLREAAEARLGAGSAPGELAEALLRCVRSRLVVPLVRPFTFAAEAGDRPVASPLARAFARRAPWAPSLTHDVVPLDGLLRTVLPLLDGTRDRAALLDELGRALAGGRAEFRGPDGRPVDDPRRLSELAAEALDSALTRLAAAALLTPLA